MFMSFEKLDLVEMRIWSDGAMLNLFINRSLEQMLVKWNVLIFSKGFLMFFFYKIIITH